MATVGLVEAGGYTRRLNASVDRVWENVFDWEHLPALHREVFAEIEYLGRLTDGYRFALTPQPGEPRHRQVFRLTADKPGLHYTVLTEAGPGAGAEVRTQIAVVGPNQTEVTVRFMAPIAEAERARRTGERLQTLYHRLWDEDEAMMVRRADMLRRAEQDDAVESLDLGAEEAVQARTPFTVEIGSALVRVAEVEGELVAFSAVCPHWLGPLDEAPLEGAVVRCPWHDYRFDVRTGESVDGRGLRLQGCWRVEQAAGQIRVRRVRA